MSRMGAPLSTHQLCCFPFPSHSKERSEKLPPCFGRKKRKQLSYGGKDSYYLLFKSGVTSGHRSMRKGNLKAERIWTLEISAQKWCLLVSCAEGKHTPMPGRLQKGPFSVAEQRGAGVLGELSQRLYTSLWLRTKLLGSQGPRETRSCHSAQGVKCSQWVQCQQGPGGTSGGSAGAALKEGIHDHWCRADPQHKGVWGSPKSWIYGEHSQRVRQSHSPSDCRQHVAKRCRAGPPLIMGQHPKNLPRVSLHTEHQNRFISASFHMGGVSSLCLASTFMLCQNTPTTSVLLNTTFVCIQCLLTSFDVRTAKLSTDNFDFPVVFVPKHISKCWNFPGDRNAILGFFAAPQPA